MFISMCGIDSLANSDPRTNPKLLSWCAESELCGATIWILRILQCTHWYHRAAPSAPVWYFLCAKEMTPVIWACFWCSFADSDCAFCAGCQLRLRMLRSGMMHRGCGRPARTLRTFSYDRAAPMAHLFCALCVRRK